MNVQPVPRSSLRTITSEQPRARWRSSRHPTRFAATTSYSRGFGPGLPDSTDHPARCGAGHTSGPGEELVDLGAEVVELDPAGDAPGPAAVLGHEPGLGQRGHRTAGRHPAAPPPLVIDPRVGPPH